MNRDDHGHGTEAEWRDLEHVPASWEKNGHSFRGGCSQVTRIGCLLPVLFLPLAAFGGMGGIAVSMAVYAFVMLCMGFWFLINLSNFPADRVVRRPPALSAPERRMQTLKRIFTLLCMLAGGTLIFLCGQEVLRGPRGFFARFDRTMQEHYEAAGPGTDKSAVIAGLGTPYGKTDSFERLKHFAFEPSFDAAARAASVEYMVWINGVNWYYYIGFDTAGKETVKAEGGEARRRVTWTTALR